MKWQYQKKKKAASSGGIKAKKKKKKKAAVMASKAKIVISISVNEINIIIWRHQAQTFLQHLCSSGSEQA